MNPLGIDQLKSKPRTPEAVSSFIRKTFELLEDRKFPDIVDWNSEGTAIVIKKPVEFGQKVLPMYFKHNNLTSFVRQLNMYDFHKRRTQKYDHVYYHDIFHREKKHLLADVKRKNQETTLATIQKAIEALETAQGVPVGEKQESITSSYENQLLKKLNKDALARISALENKVKDLTVQNQALWNQIAHQNQKEDVLVSFLATFMKTKGITLDMLPKVLKNQFNMQPLNLPASAKLMCQETGGLNGKKAEDLGVPLNVGAFLNLNDDSTNSTEISPSSPLSRGQVEAEKASQVNNESYLVSQDMFNDANKNKLEGLNAYMVGQNQDLSAQSGRFCGDWNTQPQINSRPFENMNERSCNFFEKRGYGELESLQKRPFEDTEDSWGVQKIIKKDQFIMCPPAQDESSFISYSSKKDDFYDMKTRKLDSFMDVFANVDHQSSFNIDLLNFNN